MRSVLESHEDIIRQHTALVIGTEILPKGDNSNFQKNLEIALEKCDLLRITSQEVAENCRKIKYDLKIFMTQPTVNPEEPLIEF